MFPRILPIIVVTIALISTTARTQPSYHWSQNFGGTLSTDSCLGRSVATDNSSNVFVTGHLRGTADFGGGPLTSAGLSDLFLAKYDLDGKHIWSQRFGDADDQFWTKIAVDITGNAIITGYFQGTVDFGGGPLTAAAVDMFLAKFDRDGGHIWSQSFGDPNPGQGLGVTRAHSITVDPFGNIDVSGDFNGTTDFGGGPLAANGWDFFVTKYDANGNHLWTNHHDGPNVETLTDIAAAPLGSIVVIGYFTGTLDLGGGVLTSAGGTDVFILKLTSLGTHAWSRRFGDVEDDTGTLVALDGGNIVAAGLYAGAIDFGGGPLDSATTNNQFLLKLDTSGGHLWSRGFDGSTSSLSARDLAVNNMGDILTVGDLSGTVDLGGGDIQGIMFVSKFFADGSHLWSRGVGQEGDGMGLAVAADNLTNFIISGTFVGNWDFGGGSLVNPTGPDVFLVKYGDKLNPTLLHSFSASYTESGVAVSWLLAEVEPDAEFAVLREDAAEGVFLRLENPNIESEGLHFGFVDRSYTPGATHRYRVEVSDVNGQWVLFETEPITTPKLTLSLRGNIPNPFNPNTSIAYTVPSESLVNLAIYDVDGRLVKTLVNAPKTPGRHTVSWDGRDTAGSSASSGVYFVRLTAERRVSTSKIMLLK